MISKFSLQNNFPIPSPVPCYNACCLAYFAGNRPIGAKINFDLRTVITTSVFSSIIKHIRVLLFGFVGNSVMGKANHEVTQLQKKRRMRNCRKKRQREQRAMANRAVAEGVIAQKISDGVKDQKVLAEKYYSKWKNISKKADELRRRIPVQSHIRKVRITI